MSCETVTHSTQSSRRVPEPPAGADNHSKSQNPHSQKKAVSSAHRLEYLTMADFAFSAVAAFFGEDPDASPDKKEDEKPKSTSDTPIKTGGRKQARLGLGATAADARTNPQSQIGKASGAKDIGKKILSVGRPKRGRAHDDDGDDAAAGPEDWNDDDEGDEEEGRTSAVRSRVPKRTFDAAAALISEQPAKKKKKKKKAGRKERAAAALVAEAEDQAGDNGDADANNDNEQGIDNDDAANEQTKTNKRKRKKVRSRQKNIRKDNRPAREKPAHLILGTGNYGGRALTPETRQAMNLPESRAKQRAKRLLKEGGGHGDDGNADIHDDHDRESGDGRGGGSVGLGLAVDDMLDDLGVAAGVDGSNQGSRANSKERKHKKKKKKSRFKNLR